MTEPEVDVCCQDFDKCLRSCTPRGQWIARVYCGCGDQIMRDDGAECGTCVTARNAVKQEPLAQMKEMLEVQGRDGTWNYDPYSQGMFNGMEFMVALAEGRDPVFREAPERWLHTPPQRKWQGLTDEDYEELLKTKDWGVYLIEATEDKLKEKNL
jgi:hypothetical protein